MYVKIFRTRLMKHHGLAVVAQRSLVCAVLVAQDQTRNTIESPSTFSVKPQFYWGLIMFISHIKDLSTLRKDLRKRVGLR